ncbi:MAG: hypothetical protein MOB07_09720 [Acidobacteria bacterium]|nr:hypothetical protein [Acidobacteriota bacterium]
MRLNWPTPVVAKLFVLPGRFGVERAQAQAGEAIVDLRRQVAQLLPCALTNPMAACVRSVSTVTRPPVSADTAQANSPVSETIGSASRSSIFAEFDLRGRLPVQRSNARAVSQRQRQWESGREVWFFGSRQPDAVLNLFSGIRPSHDLPRIAHVAAYKHQSSGGEFR